MDALAPADMLLFEGFRLDRRLGCLLKQGEDDAWRPVALGSRALDVLVILADQQGALLSKDEIMAAAWPGIVVDDNNLAVQISALRRVLDSNRAESSCIQTVPGRGYRFVAPVMRTNPPAPPVSLLPSGNGVDEHITADGQLQGRPGVPARPDEPPSQASRWRPRRGVIACVIGALLLVAVGLAGWHLRPSGYDGTRAAPRLSIVVLPFTNLSNDPPQQYFADALTEDLTVEMSRIANMFVISSNTAFTYRSNPADTKQIGRELGVRYVLKGSVERSGDRIRINIQMIDAGTDANLWVDHFDRDSADLFALRDEITNRIAWHLDAELTTADADRPAEQPDALDYVLRGRAEWRRWPPRDNYAQAIRLLEKALALNPQSVEARNWLAHALATRVLRRQTETPAADIARAEELVGEALTLAPRNGHAHFDKGQVLRAQRRFEEAIPEFEAAIASHFNNASAYANLGRCKFLTGSIDDVIPLEEKALRIGPDDPFLGTVYSWIGIVELLKSHTEEAIAAFEKARNDFNNFVYVRSFLAAAYALGGQSERAAAELAEAQRLSNDNRFSSISRVKVELFKDYPTEKVHALFETTYIAGLRKAGMPEQ